MKRAFVSYMANDRDLKGVLVNNYKLIKLKSKYPHVCLITKDVSDESKNSLNRFNIQLININFHDILNKKGASVEQIEYLYSKFYFGKLFIFLLHQIEEIVYLDTDLLILKNIDHLFDKIQEDKIIMTHDSLFRQTEEKGVYNVLKTTQTFSSGVMCLKPSEKIFNAICNLIQKSTLSHMDTWYGDQGIFNELYKNKLIDVESLMIGKSAFIK